MRTLSNEYIRGLLNECFLCNEVDKIYVYLHSEDSNNGVIKYNDSFLYCKDVIKYKGDSWSLKTGATKLILISDSYDEVVKIPLNGSFIIEDEEVTTDDDFNVNLPIITEDYSLNYIEEEEGIYAHSIPSVQKILTKNVYLFDFGSLPIYKQERISKSFIEKYPYAQIAKVAFEMSDSKWKNYVSVIRGGKRESSRTFRNKFLLDILDKYADEGKEIIDSITRDLDDMHEYNYGYDIAGNPVIFDYGGFYD